MSSIREELLLKAQRDTSKLVRVQRQVSRGGKTFTQNFWVQPSQVKSTDTVIGGQQNLLPTPGSVATPAAGVLDKAYLDSISSDKSKAFDYLKKCGLTWKENPHEGINWMRAMQAVKAALNGQNSVKISNQVNAQAQSQTAQNGQNSQAGNQVSADTVKAAAMLDQKTLDELSQCKNGREKVVVLKKKLGQDGCMKFAKLSGVTWDEHAHAAINNMRMSMALQQYYDAQDGTVSPNKVKGQGGGAPKGNQNAKKDTTPKVDPDKLKIPANATQRDINLINLINNVDSVDDLKVYTGVGMIPEDDVAKSFIFDKLSPKYTAWKNATGIGKTKSSSSAKIDSAMNSSSGFGILMTEALKVEGCKKDVLSHGFASWYDTFRVIQITDPRESLSTAHCSHEIRRKKSISSSYLIETLQDAFSTYTTDDYTSKYKTNLGYTGWDSSVYTARYDHDKDGFVRYLNRIAEENPDTKSQVEKMITQYDTMMEKVGYNPNLLKAVLENHGWTTGENPGDRQGTLGYSWRMFDSVNSPVDARRTLEHIEYQAKVVPLILERHGLSKEAIIKTLSDTWYNDNLQSFRLKDENGDIIQSDFDLTKEINPDTGKPYFDAYVSSDDLDNKPRDYHSYQSNSSIMNYVLSQYAGTEATPDVIEGMNKMRALSSISQSDYVEIHKLATQMFGMKYTATDSQGGKSDVVDLTYGVLRNISNGNWDENYSLEKDGYNPQLDLVLANLNMAYNSVRANSKVADTVSGNVASKLNKGGKDYSGNFSFYYPLRGQIQSSTRIKADGNWGSDEVCYTVDELNAQINKQMKTTPTVSSQYLDNLITFYNAKGGYDPDEINKITRRSGLGSVTDARRISVGDYVSDPMKDILVAASKNLLSNVPKMDTPQIDTSIAKKLDYVPYDFTAATQPTLSSLSAKPKSVSASKTELKQAREAAFKAINCSVSTEDEATSLQMRKDFLKRWDYSESGGKDPDGFTHTKMYSGPKSWQGYDRRALFNSRFFRVNNSNMEKDFTEYQQQLGETPMELYSATSYGSCAGILGVTGGWFMGNQYTKTAKALGCGAYFGYTGGKSSVYCGEGSGGYHNTYASGAHGDNANGCYILASVLRGQPGDSTSDRGRFRDFEIAVHKNKCILPHHFVDISSRSLGINVTRDAQGNYLDENGKITHDKYGQSVTMK